MHTVKLYKTHFLLLFLSMMTFSLFGQEEQEEIVLFEEDVKLGMYGAERYAFGFEKGDQMVFSLINISHRPTKAVEVRNVETRELVIKYVRPYNVINKAIKIEETGDYSFHFKNKGFFGRKINFNLKRLPKYVAPPDTVWQMIYKDSLVFDTIRSVKTINTIQYDTIPEEILQEEFMVGATRDLLAKNRTCMEVPLPENAGNYYFAYWIGIGEQANKEYQKLNESPPPHWEKVEVEDALTAYGMGLQKTLPGFNDLDDFSFFFLGGVNQEASFTSGQINRPSQTLGHGKRQTYGTARHWEHIGIPLYCCMHNDNQVSSLKIYLKVVGYKINQRVEEKEVEKLTIVEKITKVKVGEKARVIRIEP